jgi:hypothetical protein
MSLEELSFWVKEAVQYQNSKANALEEEFSS